MKIVLSLGIGLLLFAAAVVIGIATGFLAPCHGKDSLVAVVVLSPCYPGMWLADKLGCPGGGGVGFLVLGLSGWLGYSLLVYAGICAVQGAMRFGKGSFRMTKLIISFNRRPIGLALLACAGGVAAMAYARHPWVYTGFGAAIAVALYFVVGAIVAAHCMYDRSDLYKMAKWPTKCFPKDPEAAVVLHAGFDPASGAIRARYPAMSLRVLDFFRPEETPESSIQLAHRLNPPIGPREYTPLEAWPVESASQDAVFVLNAAHEIRDDRKRALFFGEARRVLKPEGRVVVIEQLRDLPNFLCFAVVAFHFLSRRTWLRTFQEAQLGVEKEFPMAGLMRVFVLR